MASELSKTEAERYSRQIVLKELGRDGQRKLMNTKVFVVGAGGLGAAAIQYLAACGVGALGIADGEEVELCNLPRQVIHNNDSIGVSKCMSARDSAQKLNPDCKVELFDKRLTLNNVKAALEGYDLVLDCTDNFPTRYLVADTCWLENIPLVTAAIICFEGHVMTIIPGEDSPCYRCLVPEIPPAGTVPTCKEAGVMGPAVGVIGTMQATEAVKIITGIGENLSRKFLTIDMLKWRFHTMDRQKQPGCAFCGKK